MRGSLSSHPKVLRIAAIIEESRDVGKKLSTGFNGCLSEIVTRDVTRDVTLASLLRVWSATNEHTSDGVWRHMRPEDLDHIAGIPGFGAAMESVGWAVYDKEAGTLTMPNFLLHNAPAKGGRANAERQKRYRERHKSNANNNVTSNVTRDVTESVTSNVEKRREEKKEHIQKKRGSKTPIPENFSLSTRVIEWAAEKGYGHLQKHLDNFRMTAAAHDYRYVDWDSALMNAIANDWAKVNGKPNVDPFAGAI